MPFPFAFWKTSAPAFNPATFSPSAYYIKPNYAEAAGVGTWTATAGTNVGAAASAPAASSGSPVFIGTPLTNAVAMTTWWAIGERFAFIVADVASITSTTTVPTSYTNEGFFGSDAFTSNVTLRQAGAGPYTYYASFFTFDATAGLSCFAEIDITTLVDGSGAGRLCLQARRTAAGFQEVRANNLAWVTGDACGDDGGATGQLIIGSGAWAGVNATIRAIGFYPADKGNTFANNVWTWSAGI